MLTRLFNVLAVKVMTVTGFENKPVSTVTAATEQLYM